MFRLITIGIIFFGWIFTSWGQNTSNLNFLKALILENDTLPHLDLPQVDVFPKAKFKSKQEELQFWRLVGKVKKVYPYAKEAARLYGEYQQNIPDEAKRRDKRSYVKNAEDKLMALYGPQLKKLTISEGRILIKLIDRETQSTSYELIDDIKGGVPAVFWQGIARIFGNNLKSKYDPYGEDRQIEQIIFYIEAGMI